MEPVLVVGLLADAAPGDASRDTPPGVDPGAAPGATEAATSGAPPRPFASAGDDEDDDGDGDGDTDPAALGASRAISTFEGTGAALVGGCG